MSGEKPAALKTRSRRRDQLNDIVDMPDAMFMFISTLGMILEAIVATIAGAGPWAITALVACAAFWLWRMGR